MRLLFLFKCMALFLLNFAADVREVDKIIGSTVILFDEYGDQISYGVVISETSMLFDKNAYDKFDEAIYFEYLNQEINFMKQIPAPPIKYPMPSGSIKKLNNATYIFESDGLIEINFDKRFMKMRRYSVCESDQNLKAIYQKSEHIPFSRVYFEVATEKVQLYSVNECIKYFPNFDKKTQVCGQTNIVSRLKVVATPLIASIDNIYYVVGLASEYVSGIALFNIFGEKCRKFPIYQKCDYISTLSEFSYCNAMEVSKDLKRSDHPEIILARNPHHSNDFAFGVVVSDNEMILAFDKNHSFNGVVLLYNDNGEKKEIKYFGDNSFININNNNLYYIKFNYSLFKDFLKAKFFLEQSYDMERCINIFETLYFMDEKLVFQKIKDYTLEVFSFPTPFFCDGKIFGFQNGKELFLASEFQNSVQ